jgi:hypothetical protein
MAMKENLLLDYVRIIQTTLFTARMIDGFWDRWRGHGAEYTAIQEVLASVTKLEDWVSAWENQALLAKDRANQYKNDLRIREAEYQYRLSALYYNLIQWIYPVQSEEKAAWFTKCIAVFHEADAISPVASRYETMEVDGYKCHGRIRIPEDPYGCIIILNPLDSSKEELFTYEMDFVQENFITISFDGPGQGETFTFEGMKGTRRRWEQFINRVIDFAAGLFPDLPLYLFGTSSGASWTLYGIRHPKITKAVAVSPAIVSHQIQLPEYFFQRMSCVMEENESIIYDFEPYIDAKPVFLFHGLQDVMVPTPKVQELYALLPNGKQYKVYEEEGHCCNFKLSEVRRLSMLWYKSD